MTDYSNRIREVRQSKKLSGVTVANSLGITPQYYYNIEKGTRTLNSTIVKKLAEFFQVSGDYLLGISNEKYNSVQLILDPINEVIREATDDEMDEINSRPYSRPEKPSLAEELDLKKLLDNAVPITFDGTPVSDDDKEKIKKIIEALFWNSKS